MREEEKGREGKREKSEFEERVRERDKRREGDRTERGREMRGKVGEGGRGRTEGYSALSTVLLRTTYLGDCCCEGN